MLVLSKVNVSFSTKPHKLHTYDRVGGDISVDESLSFDEGMHLRKLPEEFNSLYSLLYTKRLLTQLNWCFSAHSEIIWDARIRRSMRDSAESWSFSFMKKREHLYAMPQFHIRVLNAAPTNLSYIDWAVSFRLHILALSRGKIYRNIQAHLPDFFTALFNGSWKPRASCIQGLVPGVHWLTSIALVRLSLRHAMLSDNLISHPAGLVCRITYHLEAKTYSQVQKNCFQVK